MTEFCLIPQVYNKIETLSGTNTPYTTLKSPKLTHPATGCEDLLFLFVF